MTGADAELPAALDLGELTGPLLVFGGPYSNLEATRALRRIASERRIPAHQCICTGDLVAYCADPVATVKEIRDWGVRIVMGNCEESLAAGAADCGCGFDQGSRCNLLSGQWFAYASTLIDDDTRHWMATLPRRLEFTFNGLRLAVVHGGTAQINRFLFASHNDADFRQELERLGVDGVLAGHSGIPFTRQTGGSLWHNAGVIGMPANDGSKQTWYSLLESAGPGQVRIGHHRLHYDAATAAGKMRQAGLTGGYQDALETGLWPSLDVLPEQEKSETGRALNIDQRIWPHHHPQHTAR
ncbi:MAG: metallophosphoesterase family protein [Gammaproteobacteria bacterium]|nr:metallophosphoesterase family protein [Gammaproteobacteria bacterium]